MRKQCTCSVALSIERVFKRRNNVQYSVSNPRYELALKSMTHDVNAYAIWQTRAQDREAAVYYSRMAHARDRARKARDMAQLVMDPSSPNFRMAVVGTERLDLVMGEITKMRQATAKLNQLDSPADMAPHGMSKQAPKHLSGPKSDASKRIRSTSSPSLGWAQIKLRQPQINSNVVLTS